VLAAGGLELGGGVLALGGGVLVLGGGVLALGGGVPVLGVEGALVDAVGTVGALLGPPHPPSTRLASVIDTVVVSRPIVHCNNFKSAELPVKLSPTGN
jgi:hypothetical protein